MLACKHGNYEMYKYLIDHGAKLKYKTSKDETLLHIACASGNPLIVAELIKKRLDVKALTTDKESTLLYALRIPKDKENKQSQKYLDEYSPYN